MVNILIQNNALSVIDKNTDVQYYILLDRINQFILTNTHLTIFRADEDPELAVKLSDVEDIPEEYADVIEYVKSILTEVSTRSTDVTIQDATTPPVDTYFLNAPGAQFSLSVDTPISGVETLEYDFVATSGHGIIIGDEILLLDFVSDRELYAFVVNVVGDVITIDRPIDHMFAAATTICRFVDSNMAVDGSVTPVIYTMRGGTTPLDIVRMLITMSDDSPMDDGTFGGLDSLTNGLVFRVVDGYQKTVFNFKNNSDIKQFCYDVEYADKAPAGLYGLSSRIAFGGQHTHGTVFRVSNNSRIQWIVQDDLRGLLSLKVAGQGSATSGEPDEL